ncbi:MAG TPA: hypothetical protein VG711_02240 [Phycisphaerales bacterium]|nr:hypothetical protein [Phycisphaerales bacterium]
MNVASRTSSLQSYNLVLYRQALHPEFFPVAGRKRITHGGYEFEAWIWKGGHALRFEYRDSITVEVVSDASEKLPEKGRVTTIPCAGEKDHDGGGTERINYMTSIQTETLSDHLYLGTYHELLEHAKNADALYVEWVDENNRPNLSMLEIQRYADQVHVQAYHCRSDCSLVLRTQTIFEIKTR